MFVEVISLSSLIVTIVELSSARTIPVFPSIVIAPPDVVKFETPAASREIPPPASTVTFPAVASISRATESISRVPFDTILEVPRVPLTTVSPPNSDIPFLAPPLKPVEPET